jgi:hypothetical protein
MVLGFENDRIAPLSPYIFQDRRASLEFEVANDMWCGMMLRFEGAYVGERKTWTS